MSGTVFLKFLMVLILSGVVAWVIFSRYDEQIGSETTQSSRQRYLPYLNGAILPMLPLSLFCVAVVFYGFQEAFRLIIPITFQIFLHISIYYAILLPFLPLLRKHISARVCAMLWLLPNFTYISYCNSIMASDKPRFIIHIPGNIYKFLLWIWLAGFFFVIIRAVVDHILFRKKILRNAQPICEPNILKIWEQELGNAGVKKPKYRLVSSDQIATPLSIGFGGKKTRVVLPRKAYTEQELTLILRHEIIHICRADSTNKFSIIFCCAMSWFNPLVWLAMRKSADDFELSCDETVLIGADEETRTKYAGLILNTAADARGFTTCLSASADTLRYRLKNIIKHQGKNPGGLIAAAICFLLFISFGSITVSCGDFTGQELLFEKNGAYSLSACNIKSIHTSFSFDNSFITCTNEEAIKEYLSGLELSRVTGNYALEKPKNELELFCSSPDSEFYIHLCDQIIETYEFGTEHNRLEFYHVNSEIDWYYLRGLLAPRYIQDPKFPFPPEMQISVNGVSTYYSQGIMRLLTVNGEPEYDNVHLNPYFVIDFPDLSAASAVFTFTHTPSFPFEIVITDHTGKAIETIVYSEDAEFYSLPFYDDANYVCSVTFKDSVSVAEMEYPFVMHHFPETDLTESQT